MRSERYYVCSRVQQVGPFNVLRHVVCVPAASQCAGSRHRGSTGSPAPGRETRTQRNRAIIISHQVSVSRPSVESYLRSQVGGTVSAHLIKEVPVDKQCVVWLGQLTSQKGEEPAHLGGREVWVVNHDLGRTHTHTHSRMDKKDKRQRRKYISDLRKSRFHQHQSEFPLLYK